MATKRVYVYRDPGLFDSYKVFPPVIVLDQNDKFEVVNTVADHDAFVTIPDGTFQGNAVKDQKVPKKSKSDTKTPQAGPIGVEYEIKVDGHKAHGNSDPVIIIDM
jgi:hypothetical protein